MTTERTADGVPIVELPAPHTHGVTGKGRLPVDIDDLCTFLTALATLQSRVLCNPEGCTECRVTCHVWWEYFVSLTQREARGLHRHLTGLGTPLPWRPAIFLFLDPTLDWSE